MVDSIWGSENNINRGIKVSKPEPEKPKSKPKSRRRKKLDRTPTPATYRYGANYKPRKTTKASSVSGAFSSSNSADTEKTYGRNQKRKSTWKKVSGNKYQDAAGRRVSKQAAINDRIMQGQFRGKYYGPDAFKGSLSMVRAWKRAGKPNPAQFARSYKKASS